MKHGHGLVSGYFSTCSFIMRYQLNKEDFSLKKVFCLHSFIFLVVLCRFCFCFPSCFFCFPQVPLFLRPDMIPCGCQDIQFQLLSSPLLSFHFISFAFSSLSSFLNCFTSSAMPSFSPPPPPFQSPSSFSPSSLFLVCYVLLLFLFLF